MSSSIITLKEHPEILRAIRAVAPKYRKHKAIVFEADKYTCHGSYWDGGSRESAFTVDNFGRVAPVHGATAPPQFGGCGSVEVPVPVCGYIVVLGTFRGKPATAKVYTSTDIV